VATFTFWAQATKCLKYRNRTVVVACWQWECMPAVRSANPSNSWAFLILCKWMSIEICHSSTDLCVKIPVSITLFLSNPAWVTSKTWRYFNCSVKQMRLKIGLRVTTVARLRVLCAELQFRMPILAVKRNNIFAQAKCVFLSMSKISLQP